MRIVLATILIFSSSAWAFRAPEQKGPQSMTYGVLHLDPGYSYTSLLNTTGQRAIFGGPCLGAELDLTLVIDQLGIGIGPFVQYEISKQTNLRNRSDYSQDMQRVDFIYGLKAKLDPFYAGFAYGENTTDVTFFDGGSTQAKQLKAKVLGFTGGMRLFGIGGDWSVGVAAWYKNSFYGKSSNPSLTENTNMETINMMLIFTLNPLFQLL